MTLTTPFSTTPGMATNRGEVKTIWGLKTIKAQAIFSKNLPSFFD